MTFSIELTALALVAMLVDAAIGGIAVLGRFPGPDRLFYLASQAISNRLDHENRSDRVLMIRGGIVLLLAFVVLVPLGNWLGDFILSDRIGAVCGIILLLLIMGQRAALDTATELITVLADISNREDPSRFAAARWGIERLVLRLSDGMIFNVIVLFFSGLGGLLFYRMLTMTLAIGAPNGILKPASPYYRLPLILYDVMTIIPAALALLLISLASLFIPGAHIHMLATIEETVPGAILGRKLPLLTIAHSMVFTFREDPNEADKQTLWVGPANGRSKLEAPDLRNALYLIIATWVMTLFMMGLMAFPMIHKM